MPTLEEANARLIASAPQLYEALNQSTMLLDILYALIKDPVFNKPALAERIASNKKALAEVEGK